MHALIHLVSRQNFRAALCCFQCPVMGWNVLKNPMSKISFTTIPLFAATAVLSLAATAVLALAATAVLAATAGRSSFATSAPAPPLLELGPLGIWFFRWLQPVLSLAATAVLSLAATAVLSLAATLAAAPP